jgi:glutaredoxin
MSKWLIYSKNNCPYCQKAKYALRDEQVEIKNINEDVVYHSELIARNPNARTMPQIYKDDELIGGYDQLKVYLELNG